MPYFRYKIVILQWYKTYSFKIMIWRIIPTMAFLAILSLSARDVKSVSLPAADVTDAPHAWTVPPLWSELQGGYRGCREKLIFLWSVKVGLFDPLAPIRQCSCRAYYQKKSRKSFDLQDSVAEREGFYTTLPTSVTCWYSSAVFKHFRLFCTKNGAELAQDKTS